MTPKSPALVAVLSLVAMVALRLTFGDTTIVHLPLHSTVETAGGLLALAVAALALIRYEQLREPHYIWISTALVCMGLLDFAHATVTVGPSFFWSRALPTMLGGIIIACVWLPAPVSTPRGARIFVVVVGLATLPLCAALTAVPQIWPLMYAPGGWYNTPAKLINGIGGVGFVLAALFFILRARRTAHTEDIAFANHTVLFGVAGIFFMASHMWDAVWWLFHGLRLAAYCVVLGFVVDVYRSYEAKLRGQLETRLAAAADRLRHLLDQAPFAVIESEGGRITRWSNGAERMFGWPADHALDRALHEVVPPAPDTTSDRFEDDAAAHRVPVLTRDGRQIVTEWHNTGLSVSGFRTVLSIVVDVTARAETESALLEAKRAAEEANIAKDEFLAAVSHELRTPMTTIIGWSSLLKLPNADAELIAQGIDQMHASALAEKRLIDDLLEVSRLHVGKLSLIEEDVQLDRLLAEAVDAVRANANARSLTLTCDTEPELIVRGDPVRLQQVFANLLTNAVKFTPAGGRVQVRAQRAQDVVEIAVSDTGIGIDRSELPNLFQRFRQANPSIGREFGGLGLGLSIVKGLVTAHSGTVTAMSEGRGKGSTFVVRLPLRMGMSPRPAEPRQSALAR